MTELTPPEPSDAYSELIRAMRLHTGMSRDGFAREMGIAERSYERFENGSRPCPPGFINTMAAMLDTFDAAVDAVIAETGADDVPAGTMLDVEVDTSRETEWQRCVVGKAAVLSGTILPTKLGNIGMTRTG